MSDALLLLRSEHQTMAKLLALLDEQIRGIEDGESPDHHLLQSMLEYFSTYPDECHHPKEDLVFRKLSARNRASADGLNNLIDEHRELARLTTHFATLVKEMREDPDTPVGPLKSMMRHFVDFYYHHMGMEEKHFFPTALRILTRDDWAEIEFVLFDQEDPLVNAQAGERFKQLRDEISNLAERQSKRRAKRVFLDNEAKILHNLTSIAEFNETMKESGKDVRLTLLSDGRYGLESHGRLITGIPRCSEPRAVWCAYYFLEGRNARVGFI